MLDKSVPFYNILMARPAGLQIPHYELPEGYSFKMYEEGDEVDWALIERSVDEYDSSAKALIKYQTYFMPLLREAKRRTVFIVNPDGEKVGTATIWWEYSGKRRDPWVHYVAIKPSEQGKGLAKPLFSKILEIAKEIEGDCVLRLHTQTWSHIAVRMYMKDFDFEITEEQGLFKYENNQFNEARALLEEIWSKYPKK